jgi:hypothetical protein
VSVIRIELPDYDPTEGLRWPVVPGVVIGSALDPQEFSIRANPNGLRLLAFQLLALAQDGVPSGSHLHFDPEAQLEPGSSPFVIERTAW